MSNSTDGGPAFPVIFQHADATSEQEGMSLRDYFAAKAMQGCLAGRRFTGYAACAADCYAMADSMLKARKQ